PADHRDLHSFPTRRSSDLKPVEIMQSVAPCQEVVIENPKDVNEYMVPIRHTTYEPELTVGSGIRCVTGEHFDGGSDLGYNRMNRSEEHTSELQSRGHLVCR